MSINYVQKLALLSSQMWVWIDSVNELLSYILLETKGLRGEESFQNAYLTVPLSGLNLTNPIHPQKGELSTE